MVCDRCKSAVRNELEKNGIQFGAIHLGEVELTAEPSAAQVEALKAGLERTGFELIEGNAAKTVSRIKSAVVDWVRNPPANGKSVLSDVLSSALNKEYSVLSHLFSGIEGITIERYMILQRIERVKELLVYDELTIREIAEQLAYSSVQHLSNQFKKVTGLTPSHFKKVGAQKRRSLDRV